MTATTFSVTISAKDSASGTIDGINKRMAAFNQQVARTRAPFEKLADNYAKFTKLTGVDKISKGLGDVARAGFSAFQSVTRIVEPLGVIVGAASIAGMYRLATSWANFGTQLGNTAARAGLTAQQMQQLENAGRLAGVSADAMSAGMTSLRDNMVNAIGGRAPQVVGMMQALGLSMDDARRYSQDTTKALPELADKIAGLRDPTLQAEAATTLFGAAGEQMLPFLKKGSAGIAEYTEKARRYGLVNEEGVAGANRLREAQTGLLMAVEGLGNSISQQLAPVVGPLLTQFANWIALNRDWIAQGVGDAVAWFAKKLDDVPWAQIGADMKVIFENANLVANALGGWVRVGEGIIAFFALAWLAKMTLPLLTISRMLLKLPGDAAAAAVKANMELGKVGAGVGTGGTLGKALGVVGTGMMVDQAVTAFDPNDAFGTWMDRHFPGASFLDNAASHIGMGRSYEEQRRAAGTESPAGPPVAAPVSPAFVGPRRPANGSAANRPALPTGAPSGAQANPAPEDAAYTPVLNLIGKAEGTDRGRGYNETLGYGKWTNGSVDLTHMTLDQIDQMQSDMLNKQHAAGIGDDVASSATGRYQITRTTLRAMRDKYGLKGEQLFDQKEQDHLAVMRIKMQGEMNQNNLAHIWASFPAAGTGASVYRGQRTGTTDAEVQAAINAVNQSLGPNGPDRNLPTNAGTAASPGASVPTAKIDGQAGLTIRLNGFPANTSTSATQTGNGLAPLKVERSPVGY